MKKLLADYNIEEMKGIVSPSYRASQLFKWVSLGEKYDAMSNLPVALRQKLAEEYSDTALEIIQELRAGDGSSKLLFKLGDGNVIEGVYMPHGYGNTVCVSTQVGCRMGCAFCASTIGGLVRNLSAGEMYSQVISASSLNTGQSQRAVSNIVLMGSGEPLDNYDNVVKFISLVNAKEGLNISQRNITLSTCGLPEAMKRLADDGLSVNLALSLHATDDNTRRSLIPAAKKYTLSEAIGAARYYFDKTGRRVSFEYALIKGVNMSHEDAVRLKELSRGMSCLVNLIMLNHVEESKLKPCSRAEASAFVSRLTELGINATVRHSAGADVGGACGQLRNLYVGQKHPVSSAKKP